MANIVDGSVLDKELNPEQAAAAKKINGPMLILAGAGSGKTRCITYKIAHLVSFHNVQSNRILAVTFTNKAAREMKDRIQKLLDNRLPFMWMGTFHSVCLKLLKLCLAKDFVIQALGGKWFDANFSIYDDDDQRRILKEILKEDYGDNVEAADVKRIHSAISRFKNTVVYRNGLPVLQTPEIALKTALGDDLNSAMYYAKYQKRLQESNAMDFDDLLFNTVKMLQIAPKLVENLRHQFQYVVVDEYQDTNDVQYELLKLLINPETKNVTVVGDDDQSIYGWRGANIGIIRSFHRDFAPVTIVKLERNYRSTANIVKGAGSVIAHNIRPAEMEKNVFSKEEAGELIHIRRFLSDPASIKPRSLDKKEAFAIASAIAKAGSEKYSKTAVFYRTNAQSRVIEEALNKYRIPLVIFGGTKFWDRKEVKDILAYMRLLANDKDDAAFLRVINTPPRAIGKVSVDNILEKEKKGFGSFWMCLLDEASGISRSAPKLKAFTDKVIAWRELMKNRCLGLRPLVEKIISDIGYKEFLRKEDETTAEDRIGNIDELLQAVFDFEEKNPDATIESFLQDIALLTDADKTVDESKGHVTLMTIHMAKGLEFNTVHIAGCNEGIFPLMRQKEAVTREQIEEERRLFYVGCTRAEKILYLYYTEHRFFQGVPCKFGPSKFLGEIDSSVVDDVEIVDSEGMSSLGVGGYNNYGVDSFNQDVSGRSGSFYGRPSRPNIPALNAQRSSLGYGNSSRSGNYGSYGYNRSSTVSNSIKKNDKHIIYRNPIKVVAPSKPVVSTENLGSNDNSLRPGSRVRNVKYGMGTVVKSYGTGDSARVEVRFDRDGGIHTLIPKFVQVIG